MKGLAAFSPMRQRGAIRVLPPLPVFDPTRTVDEQQEKDDAKFSHWTKMVGEDRAQMAIMLFREKTGSKTLPELLTELWLRGQGAKYIPQLNLSFARPDFTVFGSPGTPQGALIIRVQGDYFHGSSGAMARDDAQKQLLLQGTAEGSPILRICDIWESSLYQSDTALELAYFHGEELPRGRAR